MAPVRIESATAQPGDSPVLLAGTLTARGVVFDDVSSVSCTGCALDLREYWLRDPTNDGGSALGVTSTVDAVVERGCQTGGDDRSGSDVTHGLVVVLSNTNLRVSDVSIRHHGDDALGLAAGPTAGSLDRFHAAMRSDHAGSCNCLAATGGHPHQVTIRDVVCDDATDDDWNFQMVIGFGGSATLEGAMVWGGRGTVVNNSSFQRLEVRDLVVAGVDTQVGSPLLPNATQGFVIRDSIQRQSSGTSDLCLSNFGAPFTFRDGIVRDVRIASPIFCLLADSGRGVLENVAVINAQGGDAACSISGACDVLGVDDPRGVAIRDVSLVWQDAVTTTFAHGLRVLGQVRVPNDLVPDGLLVHGFRGIGDDQALATVDGATIFDPDRPVSGPCLSANDHDGNADFTANAPPTTVTGVEPGFRDLAGYRVDALAGSPAALAGCGVRRGVAAPGVARHRWMHAISKLAPERLADDADGDGVPEDPEAPLCAAGQRDGCSDACPGAFDPGQEDADGDGLGDACDVACSDGSDDDGDGLADFPADPGCAGSDDASENDPLL
ncbi:MAG: hypothetical protein L0206_20155, partial [Actinobacteria bacterium]|nr:hypothetical protein [Actinomycetota bacterium]